MNDRAEYSPRLAELLGSAPDESSAAALERTRQIAASTVAAPMQDASSGGAAAAPRRVISSQASGSSWARRRALLGAAAAALLVVGTVSILTVPSVRAALEDFGRTLTGYFDGEDPPGRPLASSDAPPPWMVGEGFTGQRVLASAGGYELYLVREQDGNYGFGLDDSVGISAPAAIWERRFASHSAVVLGRGPSENASGSVPLYGVTAGDVTEVQIRYRRGPSSVVQALTGGFISMIQPARGPVELVAVGRDGAALDRVDVRRFASSADERQGSHGERPPHTTEGPPLTEAGGLVPAGRR